MIKARRKFKNIIYALEQCIYVLRDELLHFRLWKMI